MNRLIVPERSNLKTTAIVCSIIELCVGILADIGIAVMLIIIFNTDQSDSVRAAVGFMMIVSLIVTVLDAYIMYGVLVSHKTLFYLACGWMIYPVGTLLGRVSTMIFDHAEAEQLSSVILADIDITALGVNALCLLICFAIGTVLYNYHKGRLNDKRIVVILCIVVYLLSNITYFIRLVSFFSAVIDLISAVMIAAAMIISLGFGIVNYGRVAFLALSMKTTEE